MSDLVRLAIEEVRPELRPQYWAQLELGLVSAAQLVTRPDRAPNGSSEVVLGLLDAFKEGSTLATLRVVINECHRSGTCDAAGIRHRLLSPEAYYGPDFRKIEWRAAQAFVLDALMLLSPPAERSESENLRSAIQLVLDAAELESDGGSVHQRLRTEHWRTLVYGLTERDLGLQLSAVAGLLDSRAAEPNTVRRLATIVSALAGEAASSGEPGTPEERQARRDAREDAIGSLVDELASRKQRRGDWVVSIGSSLGALVGGTSGSILATPVLSLGPAIDYHGSSGWGFHGEFSPLDLGAYLSFKTNREEQDAESEKGAGVVDAGPGDVLRPSLAAGVNYLFEDSDLILLIGGRTGYAMKPGAGSEDQGAFIAVMIGAYVPLIDFN